ncbi:nitrilase-related carbon-nitrogen hydrolase [Mangrovicoccus algicola]|uniref:Amidohydrolase n=1 Tax=Mangrovicoccus algicola TaxID=2771008 RepID=A0A8J6YS77_9RHOB|nr:nitrilase-related carbon-nitrogen hydrolase [Mangrovicoccus algicola]MBE3636707.1 amidohydrolase [Mangrovicoccus algicola]
MAETAVIRLAAAAYPVEALPDAAALEAKLAAWVREAAGQGAQIAVFPEYAGMEPALIGDADPEDWLEVAAARAGAYRDHLAGLAQAHGIAVVTGSAPERVEGRLLNRAWFCLPDGTMAPVDKRMLTPWERENTALCPGDALAAFDTPLGRIGIVICYDSEFPLLARALDCDILLIPSCTDAPSGQGRLRIAAQARALEGQCVTVHATLLGRTRCPLIDVSTGCAGIYTPPDRGLPADGVLARGETDRPGWVIADAPLDLLRARRSDGEARLRADWTDGAYEVARRRVSL